MKQLNEYISESIFDIDDKSVINKPCKKIEFKDLPCDYYGVELCGYRKDSIEKTLYYAEQNGYDYNESLKFILQIIDKLQNKHIISKAAVFYTGYFGWAFFDKTGKKEVVITQEGSKNNTSKYSYVIKFKPMSLDEIVDYIEKQFS